MQANHNYDTPEQRESAIQSRRRGEEEDPILCEGNPKIPMKAPLPADVGGATLFVKESGAASIDTTARTNGSLSQSISPSADYG